jgi:hypothetical protein
MVGDGSGDGLAESIFGSSDASFKGLVESVSSLFDALSIGTTGVSPAILTFGATLRRNGLLDSSVTGGSWLSRAFGGGLDGNDCVGSNVPSRAVSVDADCD